MAVSKRIKRLRCISYSRSFRHKYFSDEFTIMAVVRILERMNTTFALGTEFGVLEGVLNYRTFVRE
jgi:hypothetical protein